MFPEWSSNINVPRILNQNLPDVLFILPATRGSNVLEKIFYQIFKKYSNMLQRRSSLRDKSLFALSFR